jgi:hypothetical protein
MEMMLILAALVAVTAPTAPLPPRNVALVECRPSLMLTSLQRNADDKLPGKSRNEARRKPLRRCLILAGA